MPIVAAVEDEGQKHGEGVQAVHDVSDAFARELPGEQETKHAFIFCGATKQVDLVYDAKDELRKTK